MPGQDEDELKLQITWLRGELTELNLTAEDDVSTVRSRLINQLEESNRPAGSPILRLLCGTRLLGPEEKIRGLDCMELQAILIKGWKWGDGYYNHHDISYSTTSSIEDAEQHASKLPECIAFARQLETGNTFFISEKGAYLRANGEAGWEWYDRVGE
eukprot:gnl/MRDRNA2_/MRDRNA2_163262_c0_seq1.p1 gnl/MRDRNA2_/MRDRNA2_163262_c0~~gnl/MRDRNA2_/MRDRNA2_163262_c0_seq1.p1  ORF type:complete len:157 (+),score=24.27 gnl/MRDRNA2_/MRDRNA2_163262_c0_seq1:73-543(+)